MFTKEYFTNIFIKSKQLIIIIIGVFKYILNTILISKYIPKSIPILNIPIFKIL